MNTNWQFSTYAFPEDSLPTDGGDWDYAEKLVKHEPIGADVTPLISLGFSGNTRTVTGECTRAFRDQLKTFWRNKTTADLIDGEGSTVSCRITRAGFAQAGSNRRFSYTLEFIAQ